MVVTVQYYRLVFRIHPSVKIHIGGLQDILQQYLHIVH